MTSGDVTTGIVTVFNEAQSWNVDKKFVHADIDTGIVTDCKFVALANVVCAVVTKFIIDGSVTLRNVVQPLNAVAIVEHDIIVLGIVRLTRELQFWNVENSEVFASWDPLGKVIVCAVVQPLNVLLREVILYDSGMTISDKLIQLEKVPTNDIDDETVVGSVIDWSE